VERERSGDAELEARGPEGIAHVDEVDDNLLRLARCDGEGPHHNALAADGYVPLPMALRSFGLSEASDSAAAMRNFVFGSSQVTSRRGKISSPASWYCSSR
jgi:hypothetical protein